MSLFKRIFMSHFLVLLAAVLLLSALLTAVVENVWHRQKVRDLKEWGVPIARQLSPENQIDARFLERMEILFRRNKTSIIFLDRQYQVVYASPAIRRGLPLSPALIRNLREEKREVGKIERGRVHFSWVAIQRGKQGDEGVVLLLSPTEGIMRTLLRLRMVLFLCALVSFLIALGMSVWFSRSLSRRIERLKQATRNIGSGEYRARVEVDAKMPKELAELAENFNQMAGELERTNQELSAFERNRQQFILDLSHELRTPLTSLRGWLEALRKGYVEPGEKERVYENMERETLRLIRLIQELMDLEKIRAGKVELQLETYDLAEIFELVRDQLAWLSEEKGLTVRFELPPDGVKVVADYDRLLQILVNLVKNGLQFTERGEVVMRAWPEPGRTVIEVADTGVGIAPEDLLRMWDRFFKADPSRARTRGETGLGLAIVKQLVEAHGGQINAESQKGEGTRFRFWLPSSPHCHDRVSFSS